MTTRVVAADRLSTRLPEGSGTVTAETAAPVVFTSRRTVPLSERSPVPNCTSTEPATPAGVMKNPPLPWVKVRTSRVPAFNPKARLLTPTLKTSSRPGLASTLICAFSKTKSPPRVTAPPRIDRSAPPEMEKYCR